MFIFEIAKDKYRSALKDYKQLLKIALPIVIFIILIFLFISLVIQNHSLNNRFSKIVDDRSYVINALDKYQFAYEKIELKFDATIINEYFANEMQLFDNFSIQTSESSIFISFDLHKDFQSLNHLIQKITQLQNIYIEEVIIDPKSNNKFVCKFLLRV